MAPQAGQIANIVPKANDPGAIMRMFREQAQAIQALQGAQVLNAATIDGGALTIADGGSLILTTATDGVIVFVGTMEIPDGSGRTQQAFLVWRDDGTAAFAMADLGTIYGHTHQQALVWFDRSGNAVFADDTVSGQGIASPYLSLGTFVDAVVPTATTTSTSFVNLQTLIGFKQQPKVQGQVLVYADSGTTGTIQIVDQLSNVLFTTNLTSGQFAYVNFGPVALAGAHQLPISLNIQGKVLTGSGKVGARGIAAIGVGS